MKSPHKLISFLFLLVSCIAATGCTVRPPVDVQAAPGRPASAEVEEISLPRDASKPQFALVVDSGVSNHQLLWIGNSIPGNQPVAAQLVTALSRVGNFSLYQSKPTSAALRSSKERGPYLRRASLTEYNEVAERSSEESSFSLGWLGGLAAIAGAIAGESGLLWSGIGVAAANPGYHGTSIRTVGMVGIDVQIIDSRTDRAVASFSASGRFVSAQEQSSTRVFGVGRASERSASSAVGQAQRIALNEVARKTLKALEAVHAA